MCFSAEASFCASALIGTIGVISVRKSTTFPQKMFAIIPLFFAIQQILEGFLWLVLANPDYLAWKQPLITGFLIFVWLIWPVYVPFSMALLEKKAVRRKILLSFLVLGFVLSLICLYILMFFRIDASAANLHIKYIIFEEPPYAWVYGILYLIPTVVSMFLSSLKKMWILGLVNLSSYVFSVLFYSGNVLSVWCFFGALASVFVLCFIILMNKTPKTPETMINQAL